MMLRDCGLTAYAIIGAAIEIGIGPTVPARGRLSGIVPVLLRELRLAGGRRKLRRRRWRAWNSSGDAMFASSTNSKRPWLVRRAHRLGAGVRTSPRAGTIARREAYGRQARRQDRLRHRRRPGHRPRHRARLRCGRRAVIATDVNEAQVHRDRLDRIRTAKLDVLHAADDHRGGRRCRPGRHPVQLRRLRASGHAAGGHRRRVGLRIRTERALDVPHHPRLPARHAGARPWRDRQHGLGRRQHQRRAVARDLRRHQGGGDRADQVGRRRLSSRGHPLQLHLPRHRAHTQPGRTHRRQRRRRPARSRRRAPPSSPASRWAAWARRRKSPRWPSIWRPTRHSSSPARPS